MSQQGVQILRVHDVAAVRQALTLFNSLESDAKSTP
jgi:dihydropteroate synthase